MRQFLKGRNLKSAFWPLVLLWLAAHAVLLGLILSLKFLTAKAMALMLMAGALLWFMMGRTRRPSLPPPPGMV